MFPREPSVHKGGNAVRVPPRARMTPRQRGFCFNVWTLVLGGPSDVGRGVCLAPRWPVRLCGWQGQGPGWWAFRRLGWGSVVLVSVLSGWSGWPTPIHGPRLRAQHDFADFGADPVSESFLPDGTGAGGALFVLPKGVWTMSTLTSALFHALGGSPQCLACTSLTAGEDPGRDGPSGNSKGHMPAGIRSGSVVPSGSWNH